MTSVIPDDILNRIPSNARYAIASAPPGAKFRLFPSCEIAGPCVAAITDAPPSFALEFTMGIWPSVTRHKTGRGYGQTAAEALENALADYLSDC